MIHLVTIFAAVSVTHGIQAIPYVDDAVANFTALLGNPDVHKFIDKVLMDAPPPPSLDRRELGEDLGGEVLASGKDDYPFCSKCKTIQSTAISAYFQQQITEICKKSKKAQSPSTKEFCSSLQDGIAELDQVLNGYIFLRSRALQHAISTCIGRVQCPTKDAYNAFFNPIVPGRLVDFTKFPEALKTCRGYHDKDLDEFCGYIATDVYFGLGLVFGYVGVFEQATGYCVRDQCHK
ncbi:hypothetical protein FOZ60_003048 [Perkinsus olseni]|uniref:Uncharacterized protein n=1 Tax=Perkinsus olseni TaxID=32597 RepID=A0A7J6PK83_PEROL|nr:hypothetical protein FOZ60_003048 [Perkinsus olseni]